MEDYPTPGYDPTFGTEDDTVLSFWASHPEDLCELLASLPALVDDNTVIDPAPPAEPTCHAWAPVENVQAAGEGGLGSGDFAVGGDAAIVEPVAAAGGGSPEGLSGTVLVAGGAGVNVLAPDFWRAYAGPDCTGCCVLRDIIHTNDRFSMKLSIHGDLGFVVDHALLVIHHFMNEIVEEKFTANLSVLDAASMKQFFVDYGYCCDRLGQVLVVDTHQASYDVLPVNMDISDEEDVPTPPVPLQARHEEVGLVTALPQLPSYPNVITEAGHLSLEVTNTAEAGAETNRNLKLVIAALLWAVPELRLLFPLPGVVIEAPFSPPQLLLDLDDHLYLQRTWGLHSTRRVAGLDQSEAATIGLHKVLIRKTGIAAQRERTGLLEFGDIARVFHLPITDAANELQICTTALKKVCRRYSVYRWPHRKVQSAAKRIESLRGSLRSQKGLESARTLCLLYDERRELRILYRVRV